MTVKELKEILSSLSDDTKVLIPGWEEGFETIEKIEFRNVHYYEKAKWLYGPYHTDGTCYYSDCDKKLLEVLIIL